MNDLLTQFEILLEDGKLEEAKAMLSKLASRELTKEDVAEANMLEARLSIKLTNAINQAYLDTLDESIAQLTELQARNRGLDEKVKLARTRASLAK